MVPKHNDDPYSDDEEEQERAPKLAKVLLPAETAAIRMPLKLTSSLTGMPDPLLLCHADVYNS